MKDTYLKLYEKQDKEALILFLKELTPAQKKELLIILEDCNGIFNHVRRCGRIIDFMYTATFIVCCNQKQFSTLVQLYNLNLPELDKIWEWYCPDWFNTFLNKEAEKNWFYIDYPILLDWTLKGFIQPSQKLLTETLARYFSLPTHANDYPVFTIEELDKHPVTLDEHIWLLFKQVSWLDVSNNDSKFNASDKQDSLCSKAFIHYTSNGRLDKIRVLKECLLTVNNNFKKDLSGEFTELYKRLNPQPEEIKQIQPELFNALSSTHTVMIETVLQSIRQIIPEKEFSTDDFLASIPTILTSKTKKNILLVLSIVEQIAKNKEDKREAVCLELLPAFLNKDTSIQKKAAEILIQWGNPESQVLKESLSPYTSTLLQTIQIQLKAFLQETETTQPEAKESTTSISIESPINQTNAIKPVKSFDDFLFYLSQLFTSEEVYLVEFLPTLIKQFDKEITADKLPLLEVIFKEAVKRVSQPCIVAIEKESRFGWDARLFKHIAATYLMEYGRILINRYPEQSKWLQIYYEEAVEADKNAIENNFYPEPQFTSLEKWVGGKRTSYKPLHRLMLQNKKFFTESIDLPILSLPTHAPAWIDSTVLIERIKAYQEASHAIYPIDLELALSRCFIEDTEAFIRQAEKTLNEKDLSPVKEWFDKTLPEVENYIQQITWAISEEQKESPDYSERYALEINLPDNPWANSESIFSAIGIDKEIDSSIDLRDLPAYIWFYPNTPEVVCARILKEHFAFSQIPNADTRNFILSTIQTVAQLKCKMNRITTLFLAACLLSSNKNISDFAIGIWIEKNSSGLIDNEELGSITGTMINNEWTIPKRLSDAILNNFLSIDTLHTRESEKLLVATLANIHKPVANLKKLLEAYQEVTSLNNTQANIQEIPQLHEWENEKSLKAIVKKLLN